MLPEIEELATLVVCEDDEATRELLGDHLTADRYRVLPAPSASDALRLCAYNHPDLLVLDLCLPDAGGIEVLREIRLADGESGRFDPELPVIVLSGRGSEADRLRGFAAGADDYLVKPFHYPELAARVAAVLRRRSGKRRGPLRVGELVVDPVTRRVRVRGREVKLANKEFELLRTLASDPDRVFTKNELLRDVWGFRSTGRTRTLDSHASRLRRKLDPEASRFVFNCWGVGYRLVGMISPGHRRRLNRALHELRRPLQALALMDDRGQAPPGGAARRGLIELASDALLELDGALNGDQPLRRAPRTVRCRDLVHASLDRWRASGAQGTPIRLYWDAGAAAIEGDPVAIARAFDNLIANALEHGGPPLVVTGAVVAGRLRVTVANGRSGDERPAESRDPRRGHGVGIVSRVASAHRGRFAICETSSGCVAALELPLADAGLAQAA